MGNLRTMMGGNGGLVGAAVVVAVVLAFGYFITQTGDAPDATTPAALVQPQSETPQPETAQTDTVQTDTAETDADPTEQPQTETAQTDADPEAVQGDEGTRVPLTAPAFDEVRREPDGTTVIAGRAAPGATVTLLRDGVEIATTTADGAGKFAALVMIAPDGEAHVLSLSQTADGTKTASTDEIILAPTKAPVEVAQADPAPAALPDADTPQSNETAQAADQPASETPEMPASPDTQDTSDVAVLKSTAEGIELLNPSEPAVMDAVALDTISYSDAGDVQLAGRAQPDTENVRIYIDNDAVITLPVDTEGRWRGDVPDVDEGIYTLRVDEVSRDGTVTSRIETPFKRESATVLSEATAAQEGPIKAVTVQAGATLWAIARDRYGDGKLYVRVVEANRANIRDPDLIYPGQVFDLPE